MKKLEKEVNSKYRFMHVYNDNGTIVVKGTIVKSNLIIVSDKFLNDCKDILDIMRINTDLYMNLNGSKASIYKVMRAYESNVPSNRQRYKGLGEMDAKDLAESTLSINDRTLIRYTMDSAKEAINFIREYESDNKKILQHVGLVTRDDLLD
jgi:DNA gyrase/topoisomerase IV subunit B